MALWEGAQRTLLQQSESEMLCDLSCESHILLLA